MNKAQAFGRRRPGFKAANAIERDALAEAVRVLTLDRSVDRFVASFAESSEHWIDWMRTFCCSVIPLLEPKEAVELKGQLLGNANPFMWFQYMSQQWLGGDECNKVFDGLSKLVCDMKCVPDMSMSMTLAGIISDSTLVLKTLSDERDRVYSRKLNLAELAEALGLQVGSVDAVIESGAHGYVLVESAKRVGDLNAARREKVSECAWVQG
mgnify:CR=1 FL=1